MRDNGFFVQRIESGTTGRGIPDLFYASNHSQGWIELKVAHCNYDGTAFNIRWRSGQQAWMIKASSFHVKCHTIVGFNDCYCLVPMQHIHRRTDKLLDAYTSKNLLDILMNL